MKAIWLFSLFLSIISACNKHYEAVTLNTDSKKIENSVIYAKGFRLNSTGGNSILIVKNPWQNAKGIEYKYILSDTLEKSYPVDEFTWAIRTPVKRVISLSTTHVGLISFMGKENTIKGVSGRNYIVNEFIRDELENNRVFDVGYDEGLDYELIIKLKPDVVFAYGVSVSVTNAVRKLNELGIPVILIGEYLESDPLGKMEWVKAISACYNIQKTVSYKFDSVAHRYTKLKQIALKAEDKPEVLLGLPWRGNWYVSGARSYIARLISDAGGNYIWREFDFNESRPMGLELIYEKALTAEYWINPGEAKSKEEIKSVDPRFGNLPVMKTGRLYNNDNRQSPAGGNDFFENGVVEPDIILSDLIAIMHPHLLPSHILKYYRKVN